jgi:hypothetical protein
MLIRRQSFDRERAIVEPVDSACIAILVGLYGRFIN